LKCGETENNGATFLILNLLFTTILFLFSFVFFLLFSFFVPILKQLERRWKQAAAAAKRASYKFWM